MQAAVVTKTPPATASYTIAMIKAIAPSIDLLAQCLKEGTTSSDPFAVNKQLMTIQGALAEAKTKIEATTPADILAQGGNHTYFIQISQRHQGSWIRDTYLLISSLAHLVRSELYAQRASSVQLRNDIVTKDSGTDLSLPRLMRAIGKSHLFTDLYLGIPRDRELQGLKTDFASRPFNRYLANSSNVV